VVVANGLFDVLSPILAAAGLELVDLQVTQRQLQVVVDKSGGVDLDALAEANRAVSRALDELDPIPGRYTLEVSSPGLERKLRTPEHFARAIGELVTVRTLPSVAGERRLRGRISGTDESGFVLEDPELPGGSQRVAYADVERARTVFEWGSSATAGKAEGRSPSRGAQRGERTSPKEQVVR
jgi:ribosome maturation factor RimP